MLHLHFTHSLTLWRLPMTYISIPRGYISRYTQWPNNVGLLLMFIVTNILLFRKKSLKCREKNNLILTTDSLKLNSSNVCVLIDSIFAMGGKLLFSTDSDIYFFSFLVVCYFHHIVTIVVVLIGINSFRYLFVLSFTLSIPHRVFLTLYTDTT
jgi:hypothetical protein